MHDEENRNHSMGGWGMAIMIICAAFLVLLLFSGGMMGWGMMGPGMMGRYGYSVSPWWSIARTLFWVVILGGGVLWFLRLRQSRPIETGVQGGPRPLEILQERYAKGELTKEQYEQMRADLAEHP
jgi:putative membrane protein